MAVIVVGERVYGRIEEFEGTSVATRMVHVYFFPLAPVAGSLVFKDSFGIERALAIPLEWRSVFAAYARWWSVPVAIAAPLLARASAPATLPLAIVAAVALLIVAQLAARRLGRLDDIQRAQRRVYRDLTGLACDAARLAQADRTLHGRVHEGLLARGKTLDPSAYRVSPDPSAGWAAIALDPMVRDPAYLCGALTIARIERGLAKGVAARGTLDRAHEAIWEKLAPLLAAAPVDWRPWHEALSSSRARSDAQPSPSASGLKSTMPVVDIGPTERGHTFERGWEVAFAAEAYAPPSSCASCGVAADRSLSTKKDRLSLAVPYCAPCHAQASTGWARAPYRELQIGLLLGASTFGVVAMAPGLALVPAIVASTFAAVLGSLGVLVLIPLRKRVGPATATVDGARLVRAGRGGDRRATLFCTHRGFAEALAAAHGTTAVARTRPHRALPKMLAASLLAPPIAAFVLWGKANPSVRIDNGIGEPIQIWVDGARSIVVPPSTAGAPSTLSLHWGRHLLGWSPLSAPAPTKTTAVAIELGGAHLYVPDARLCHYLDVTLYGKQRSYPVPPGPLPVRDFHTLAHVDVWFGDNPKSIGTQQNGEARIAIRRWEGCQTLQSPPCPDGQRARYWACVGERWLSGDAIRHAEECAHATIAACGGTMQSVLSPSDGP